MADDCIFCKINIGEIPSEKLYQDDDCFVIRDIAPKAPTHLLIIPKRHMTYLTGLTGMTPEFQPVIGAMYKAASLMAVAEDVADTGYRLIVNQRGDAGQEVPHLHMHLLAGRRLGPMG
ncbi:MAG: histidine triad nucleotide-binding protein [Chloroflexi bacterium]|nr:histidine triad nucleotide-binding protein [Chloroflexota bacterium]